jgi:hypothetical protein
MLLDQQQVSTSNQTAVWKQTTARSVNNKLQFYASYQQFTCQPGELGLDLTNGSHCLYCDLSSAMAAVNLQCVIPGLNPAY